VNLKNFLVAGTLHVGVLFYSGCATNTKMADSSVRRLVFIGVKSAQKFSLRELNPGIAVGIVSRNSWRYVI
jgi:hypothetical protein